MAMPKGSLDSIDLEAGNFEKSFSKMMKPAAYILSMQQFQVILLINPANHTPRVQIDHFPQGYLFP